jgi:hypothetical protein
MGLQKAQSASRSPERKWHIVYDKRAAGEGSAAERLAVFQGYMSLLTKNLTPRVTFNEEGVFCRT